jgi:hypothetical protein
VDYAFLRQEGIRQLQKIAGETWTDHNAHDPGITILEQLCYALTDLAYRAGYDLPDLLALDGPPGAQDPYASLHGPAEVLTSGAVTVEDLRRIVIDVDGVRNAWIDLVEEVVSHDSAHDAEVSYVRDEPRRDAPPSPNVSEVRLKGLYRVQIEMSNFATDGGAILREAAQRLHRSRALGQDYHRIELLKPKAVALVARLEIGAVADPVALLAEVYRRIDAYMSPAVPVRSLSEMLERGKRLDQIFEGPLLESGYIDPQELAAVERRTALRLSDLIREVTAVPGVVAVKSLHFRGADGKARGDWVLEIEAGSTPRFEPQASDIRLEKGSLQVDDDIRVEAQALFARRAREAARPPAKVADELPRLKPRPGRDRRVATYYSVQQQFPTTYGIGAAGLPASASPLRQAQAQQLKAYLLFFDQLLANHFAQLANAAKLLSFHDQSSDSYFSEPVADDGTLGLDAIRVSPPQEHRTNLRKWTEGPRPGVERRNRFLDHLLARFGEQFREYALVQAGDDATADGMTPDERLADDKRAFLRDYPRIGRTRGNGFNCLAPLGASQNYSGLELTLRRRLGIREKEEYFYLVEHILLRPLAGDRNQSGPLLRKARSRDPYSLQLTFVFPEWPARFQGNFKEYIMRTVREEAPAHLTTHIVWKKDQAAMDAFAAAYRVWLAELRSQRLRELGIADG